MDGKGAYITLYLSNGATLQFHDVTNIYEGTFLSFNYVSQSTGRKGFAKFLRTTDTPNIIGHSICE
jgi:hypothetical protein